MGGKTNRLNADLGQMLAQVDRVFYRCDRHPLVQVRPCRSRRHAARRQEHWRGEQRVEKAKPDPDVFLMAAQCLGVERSDCIVGDSVWDLHDWQL